MNEPLTPDERLPVGWRGLPPDDLLRAVMDEYMVPEHIAEYMLEAWSGGDIVEKGDGVNVG